MAVTINHQTNDISATSGSLTIDGAAASGYTDADVDTHLNTGTASADEVLSWNGSDYDWISAPAALLGNTDTASPYETSLGSGAGAVNTGSGNTLIGYLAGNSNTTGFYNTVSGYQALTSNTTGNTNTVSGYQALTSNTTGIQNTVSGAYAMMTNTTGISNTATGLNALFANRFGNNNTANGYNALSTTLFGDNNTGIGYNAQCSSSTASNEVTLGNSSVSTLRCQVTTITSLSDARDKTDVQPLNAGLEFVEALNPVSFTWNMRDGGKVGVADTGFIAQDLQAAQADTGVTIPDLVYDINPDKLEAGYGKLIPVLVQAVKDLSEKVKDLEAKLEAK
jgi:hypothetical protein